MFRIDQVVAQVSQPRGPCATLARRHGLPEFVRICVQAGHTGWYLRILRCGTIRAGQAVSRVSSHLDGVSIAEANRLRYADPPDRRGLERLLAIDALSDEWRKDVAKLLTRT